MSRPPSPADAPHSHETAPEDYLRRKVKAEMRKRIRGLRRTAPLSACLERSKKIIEALDALEVVKAARSVALFWPIEERHEVDLRSLDAKLRARGVAVHYPAIDPETGAMTFRLLADPNDLAEAGYGFAEPPVSSPEPGAEGLDVIVVPAIAVDPNGHRLGYGAGYYDRTLPRFCPPAVAVVVAYDYQLIAEVPITEGDFACATVVTDHRTFTATPRDTSLSPPSNAEEK